MTTSVNNTQIEPTKKIQATEKAPFPINSLPIEIIFEILKHAITSPNDILRLKSVCKLWNGIIRFNFMPIMSKVFGLPRRNPFSQPSTNTKMALAEKLHNHAKDIAEIMSSNRPEDIGPFISFDLSKSTRSEKLYYLKQAILENKEDLVKIFSHDLNLSHSEKFKYLKGAILIGNKAIIKFFLDNLTLSDAEKKELIPNAITSGNMAFISAVNLNNLSRADKIGYLDDALRASYEDLEVAIEVFAITCPKVLSGYETDSICYAYEDVIEFFASMCPNDLSADETERICSGAISSGYFPLVEKLYKNLDKATKYQRFIHSLDNADLSDPIIKFLCENNPQIPGDELGVIISEAFQLGTSGSTKFLKHIDFSQYGRHRIICFFKEAIKFNSEDGINFFLNQCPNLSEKEKNELFEQSIKSGNVAFTNYLLKNVISNPIKACVNALDNLYKGDQAKIAKLFINKILANKSIIIRRDLDYKMLLLTTKFGLLDQMKVILEKRLGYLIKKENSTDLPLKLLDLSIMNNQPEVMSYILTRFAHILNPNYIGQKFLPFIIDRAVNTPHAFWDVSESEAIKHLLNALPEISLDHVQKALESSLRLEGFAKAVLEAREDVVKDHGFTEEFIKNNKNWRGSLRNSNAKSVKKAYENHKLSEENEYTDHKLSEAMAILFQG